MRAGDWKRPADPWKKRRLEIRRRGGFQVGSGNVGQLAAAGPNGVAASWLNTVAVDFGTIGEIDIW